MCTLHEHIVVAYHGLASSMGSTIDHDILTEDVVVANDTLSLLTPELEILWEGSNDRSLVHLVAVTHAGTVADADKGEYDTVVTNHHIVLDIGEGEYLAVVADFCLGAYFGFWAYF
jgi:hypothetical protein